MKKLVAVMMLGTTLMPAVSRADIGHDIGVRNESRHDVRRDDNRWHPTHEVRPIQPIRPIREVHRGTWTHSYHNGQLGWWFVLAGAWYAVNRAAYEAQAEPVVVEQQPAPVTVITAPAPVVYQAPPAPTASVNSPYWYYCRSTNSYYPYVSGCAEGWQQVAATPVQ